MGSANPLVNPTAVVFVRCPSDASKIFLSVITFCTQLRRELFIGSGCQDLKKNSLSMDRIIINFQKISPPTIFMDAPLSMNICYYLLSVFLCVSLSVYLSVTLSVCLSLCIIVVRA